MVGFLQRMLILVTCCLVQRFKVSRHTSNTTAQQPSPTSPASSDLSTANSFLSPPASYVSLLNVPKPPPRLKFYSTPTFSITPSASPSNVGDLKFVPLAVLAGIVILILIGLGMLRKQRLQVCLLLPVSMCSVRPAAFCLDNSKG